MKCDVCNVNLNSMVQFNQHMTGQSHAKKLRQRNLEDNPPPKINRGQGQGQWAPKGQNVQDHWRGQGRDQDEGQDRLIRRSAWSGGVPGSVGGRDRGAPGRVVAGREDGQWGDGFGFSPFPSLSDGDLQGEIRNLSPQIVDALRFAATAAAVLQSPGMGLGRGLNFGGTAGRSGGGGAFGRSFDDESPFMSNRILGGGSSNDDDDDDDMDNPMGGSLMFGGGSGNNRQAFRGSSAFDNNRQAFRGGSAFDNNRQAFRSGSAFNDDRQAFRGGSAFDDDSPPFGFNRGNNSQAFRRGSAFDDDNSPLGFNRGNNNQPFGHGSAFDDLPALSFRAMSSIGKEENVGRGRDSAWSPENRRDRRTLLRDMGYMGPQTYLMPAPQQPESDEEKTGAVDWNAPVVFGDNMGVVSVNLEDTKKSYCEICCVSMTSQDQAYMHYRGKRHLKNARVARLHEVGALTEDEDQSGSDYFCAYCNVSVNTLEQLETHRGGLKHKRMVDLRKRRAEEETGDEPNRKRFN